MRISSLIIVAALASACGAHSPTAPAPVAPAPVVLHEMSYDINIPNAKIVFDLRFAYPQGIHTSPLDAQARWDYTFAYGGSPNVYYGETGPHCEYVRAGIVVAPRSVAGLLTFTAGDWPGIGLEAGVTYTWVGRFVFTATPAPGSYVSDPTGALCGAVPKT